MRGVSIEKKRKAGVLWFLIRLCQALLIPLPPFPRRHGMRIDPQAFLRFSCFLLKFLKLTIVRRILPIPSAPALFDQFVIDVGAVGQEHISNSTPILVLAMSLERDLFAIDKG